MTALAAFGLVGCGGGSATMGGLWDSAGSLFGNSPTLRGGTLERDVRCDDPAPRIETVVFRAPPAGAYRVGVDFPARCRRTAGRVSYALVVRADGLRQEQRGQIDFGRFDSNALAFELPGTGD